MLLTLNTFYCIPLLFIYLTLILYLFTGSTPDVTFPFKSYALRFDQSEEQMNLTLSEEFLETTSKRYYKKLTPLKNVFTDAFIH